MLEEITVEMPGESELLELCHGDEDKAKAVEGQLKDIREGKRFFTVDSARRIHSNLTSLKRGARKYLRVRGEPLWQVDLPCCHLLALAHQCLKAGVRTAEEFLRYCERDFYSELAKEGGFTRKDVKEAFTKKALNASNRHRYQRSPVMRFFRRRWRHVASVHEGEEGQRQADEEEPPSAQPPRPGVAEVGGEPRRLQGLRPHQAGAPDCWIGTIHDAVACLERDTPFVVRTVEEELKALGITLAPGRLAAKPM